jgi:S1-C subfamily serine protease
VIVEVDGKPIDVAADLGRVLDALKPGDAVDVKVIGSSGQERTISVALGTTPLPTEFLQP